MKHYAILTNAKGETLCGSDGVLPLDGRWHNFSVLGAVYSYRERFRRRFPNKAKYYTHYYTTTDLRNETVNPILSRIEL